MSLYAYYDFCFTEKCNLTCSYCRTTNKGMLTGPQRGNFDAVINKFLAHSTAAILKVSGYGEASLWESLEIALYRISEAFPVVEVMTNGTMQPRIRDKLCELDNIAFCTTIDGNSMEANQHRTKFNSKLHNKMFDFVERVISKKRSLEVNCVLSKQSIGDFFSFAAHMKRTFGNCLKIMPFPFRHFVKLGPLDFYPSKEQIDTFEKEFVLHFHEVAEVLPPVSYMMRLITFLKNKARTWPCYIHRANFGMGPTLEELVCACGVDVKPSSNRENLSVDGKRCKSTQTINEALCGIKEKNSIFIVDRCRNCFTHYEILNLFLDNVCSEDEVAEMPPFHIQGVIDHLKSMKLEIEAEGKGSGGCQ